MDADRHVHPRPTPRSTPQRLKIESTEGHPCSRHGVTTPPTDRHRADDALTAAITPSRWRPMPPSSSSSRVTASSSFSVPGNIPTPSPSSGLVTCLDRAGASIEGKAGLASEPLS